MPKKVCEQEGKDKLCAQERAKKRQAAREGQPVAKEIAQCAAGAAMRSAAEGRLPHGLLVVMVLSPIGSGGFGQTNHRR